MSKDIKCFVERLYHFDCADCPQWWTIADGKVEIGDTVYCPRCSYEHLVTEFEIGEDKLNETT